MPPVNRLIAALPRLEQRRLAKDCDPVELHYGDILAEPGETIRHVYFPLRALISLVTSIDGRASLEVGLVGDEGMLGTSLILGLDVWPLRAMVQGTGSSLRMEATQFCRTLAESSALRTLLKRYTYVVMGQLAQAAACTHYHRVEARLARWLLMTGDRAHSNDFHVTHEFMASLLGVRRVGVTKAATALHARNLIGYRRGDVTILDRSGLEAAACACYATDKATYARVMGF